MVPRMLFQTFYLVFIGCFLLQYVAMAIIAFTASRQTEPGAVLVGTAMAILSALLVGIAADDRRRLDA